MRSPCRQPALYLSSLAISAAINLQLPLARNPSIKSSAEICGEDVCNTKNLAIFVNQNKPKTKHPPHISWPWHCTEVTAWAPVALLPPAALASSAQPGGSHSAGALPARLLGFQHHSPWPRCSLLALEHVAKFWEKDLLCGCSGAWKHLAFSAWWCLISAICCRPPLGGRLLEGQLLLW